MEFILSASMGINYCGWRFDWFCCGWVSV